MKVLILKNFATTKPWGQQTIDSIISHTHQSVPLAQFDVCAVTEGEQIPDIAPYDLIILTGGTYNLLDGSAKAPWVEAVLDLIRRIDQQNGMPKLLGLCWGHQVTQFALGGELGTLEEGPRIGIQEIELSPEGQKLFNEKTVALHKFHKRFITAPAPTFTSIAKGNEILVSKSNKIITFQGHPELTYEISQGLIDGDDGSYTSNMKPNPDIVLKDIASPHDGGKVWARLMDWASSE